MRTVLVFDVASPTPQLILRIPMIHLPPQGGSLRVAARTQRQKISAATAKKYARQQQGARSVLAGGRSAVSGISSSLAFTPVQVRSPLLESSLWMHVWPVCLLFRQSRALCVRPLSNWRVAIVQLISNTWLAVRGRTQALAVGTQALAVGCHEQTAANLVQPACEALCRLQRGRMTCNHQVPSRPAWAGQPCCLSSPLITSSWSAFQAMHSWR